MHRKLLMCLLVVLALAAGSAQGSTAGVVTGTGFSDFSECQPDSLQLVINGVEAGPGNWAFDVAALNMDTLCGMFPAITVPFAGPWSTTGGCMPGLVLDQVIGPLNLCLVNPTADGPMTVYDFSVCETPVPCHDPQQPDQVTVVVAEA